MKKVILSFTALSVLLTSCTSKHVIPSDQVLQDPEKYKIEAVTTLDGQVIEFPKGANVQHGRVVGFSKDGTLKRIPLSELKWIRGYDSKAHTVTGKGALVLIPICLLILYFCWYSVYAIGQFGAQ
jgi:hypothetical protein